MGKYPGIEFQTYHHALAQRLTRNIAAILLSITFACLISSPVYAVEPSSLKHSALEQEIAARLMRGEDVASLVKQVPSRTTPAARYQSDDTARGLDHLMDTLHLQLQIISRKGGIGAEDVPPLQAIFDEFKANHLLLTAQFASARTRLENSGTGSDIRLRLESAENNYNTHVAKLLALEETLQRLKNSSDLPALLNNADFRKKSLIAVRGAIDALNKYNKPSQAAILRASTLPYRQAQLTARAPLLTPTIQPSYRSTSDSVVQPQLADTADSIDAPLSEAILYKAKELDHDYIRIYEYVRNSIKTEWYAGGMKGAVGTLRQGSGNDVDQASLLIALFRASGLASRYVHGVVELPIEDVMNSLGLQDATQATAALSRAGVAFKPVIRGGRVAAVQVEHTWVAAHVPYTNYRGSVVDGSGKTWLPLAPSLKQYQWNAATGVFRKAGLSADSLIGDYLSASQNNDLLTRVRKQISDYLQSAAPDQTYEQQLGNRTVIGLNIGLLPTSLPVSVIAVTKESATLADTYKQRVRLVARQGTGATDPIILDLTVPVAEVESGRVTLSYIPATVDDQKIVNSYGGLDLVPAYLIKLRPQIKVDGKTRAVAQEAINAGVEHRFELFVLGPYGSQRIEQTFIAGSYHAIGIVSQHLSAAASSVEQQVNPTNADPADTEYPAARLLSWRALGYIDEWNRSEEEFAGLLGIAVIRPLPAVTIASNATRVDSVLGQPMKLQWQGITLDAALRIAEPIPTGTDATTSRDWMRLSALQGSSLEHLLFEREFLVNSISADKGLGLARAANIPVYAITSTNLSTVLPTLSHPDNVKADIENWVRLGMTVEAPRDPLVYQAWYGSVWRVEEPKSGAAGYFIAGSLAGGATADDPANWTLQDLADYLQSPNTIPSNPDPLAGAEIVKITATDGQDGKAGTPLSNPLAVMVRDENGSPVNGAQVTFYATAGGGSFDGGATSGGIFTSTTNELGIAQVDFTLGKYTKDNPIYVMLNQGDEYVTRAGLNYIDVTVDSYHGTLTTDPFSAIAYPKAPAKLNRTNPVDTTVLAGMWADTIMVNILDEFDNTVSNVPVTFAVGSFSPTSCSRDNPPAQPPVVFNASIEGSDCPTNPILGDCGSPSRTANSNVYGVQAGVISGIGISSFSILASAPGVSSASWQYSTYFPCDSTLSASAMSTSLINDEGKVINAAKISDTFKYPIDVNLFIGSTKYGWSRADADSASFQVDNYGWSNGAASLGNGSYRTSVTTGPYPALNKVTFTAVNPGGHKHSDGSDWVFSTLVNGVYGIDAKITKTESGGIDPNVIYLTEAGQSAYPVLVDFSVAPTEYMSQTTEIDFLKNGVWEDYAIVMKRTGGDGNVPLPRGTVYNIEDTYEAQLVLNRGSDAEVKSDKFRLNLRQQIFKNVSRSVKVSQDVDFVNQLACPMGSRFYFTLTQPATVTLSFKDMRNSSSIETKLIDNQSYAKGEQYIDIHPDDLSPGDYNFVLSGISDVDGHEDVVQGIAISEYKGTSALPVGQTIVKGVNVRSGSLSLGSDDFTVPGRGIPLHFSRAYSSSESTIPGVLGIGWSHNYESRLVITPCGEVIVSGEGTGMRFVSDGNNGYKPLKGYHGTLKQNEQDGSYDFYSKDGTHYHYRQINTGNERYLEYIEDTNHNVTKLAYDPSNLNEPKLISVQDSSGRTLTFTYEIRNFVITGNARNKPQPVITKVTGPAGLELNFTYNDFGNLISASREGNSRVETYGYSSANSWVLDRKLISYTNPNGAVTSYEYNEGFVYTPYGNGAKITQPNSFVKKVTEPQGGITRFEYDLTNFKQTTVTDPRGNATVYDMNIYGSVVSMKEPTGTTTMTWADNDVVMTSKTNGRGATTAYTYDTNGNILSETTGGYTTSYTYETFTDPPIKDRVKTIRDRNGNITNKSYDGSGNLLSVTNPEGGVVQYSYASNGDRRYTRDPKGGATRFTYDGYGSVDSITDPLGGITHMSNDERGQLLSSTDPLGRKSTFAYDTLGNVVSKTDAMGGGYAYTYDAVGNKLSETDPEHHTTSYIYDRESRVTSITNAMGDVKNFVYDANGNKTSETDWRGNITTYSYDAGNRLVSRTEPLGRASSYSYDEVGNVTSEKDALNRTTSYTYDDLNRRTKVTDALSNVTTYTYDGLNKISETDALSRITSYSYNKNNLLIAKVEPLGHVRRYEYDANGNPVGETDPNGNRRTYAFDALNRMVKTVDALGNTTNITYDAVGNVLTEINPRLAQTRHEYDALNRHIKTTDAAGSVTLFSYDKVGNLTGETWANGNHINNNYDALNRVTTTSDNLGLVASYSYDADSNRTEVKDARGNASTHTYDALGQLTQSLLTEARTVKFQYDLVGNKTRETDANGNDTVYAYDARNRLTSISDPFSRRVIYTYDAVGNMRSETDKRNNTTTFDYDDLNRLVKSTDPLGQPVTFSYDANGNKTSETDKRGNTTSYTYDKENRLLTTAKGGITLASYEYDEVGNKVAEQDALGNKNAYKYDLRNLLILESLPLAAITNFKYDAMGDQIEVRDPEARVFTYAYDLRRRLLSETNGAGEATSYTYDANGNRLTLKRPLGNTSTYAYDAADRLTTITDPLGGITRYGFDKNGNRVSQTDANGNTTHYIYNALNQLTTTTYMDGAREDYQYDEAGNLVGLTDPNRQSYIYTYDALNREMARSYPAPSSASSDYIQSITTTYDANSNVTSVTESYSGASGNHVTTNTYDLFDRQTSVTDGFGKTIRYQYDANGNRTRLTDPDNNVTQYSFDALNRLTGVINGGGATSYEYDRSSLKTRVTYPNGTQASQSYDRALRISTIQNNQGAATISAYQYSYDLNGNRTQQIEANGGSPETTTYTFDADDRLIEVVYPDETTHYTYDAAYNRLTERTLDNATQLVTEDKSYSYNTRNQLTDITDNKVSAQSISYSYDANGNQTLKSKNGVVTTFIYDVRDQLVSVQENTTTLGLFYYNYQGMRVARDMGGAIVRYTYDDASVLLQSDTQGQTLAKYEYGPDQLLSMQYLSEGRQYYLFDALGSVTDLTNLSGVIQARYQYDAFGNIRVLAGSSWNRYTFTGHEYDNETGLYYFGARFYDPDTGRFISQDLYLGDTGTPPSLHRYLYAYANPVVYVDLYGYYSWDEFKADAKNAGRAVGNFAKGVGNAAGNMAYEALATTYDLEQVAYYGIKGAVTGEFEDFEYTSAIGKAAAQGAGTGEILYEGVKGTVMTPVRVYDAIEQGDMEALGEETFNVGMMLAGGRSGMGKLKAGGSAVREAEISIANQGAKVLRETPEGPGVRTPASSEAAQRPSSRAASRESSPAEMQGMKPPAEPRSTRPAATEAGESFGPDSVGAARVKGSVVEREPAGGTGSFGKYVEAEQKIAERIKASESAPERVPARSDRAAALKKQGFQDHHIISDKNPVTKNHELLDIAEYDLQSRSNKMFLPKNESLHPTRSIHKGKHRQSVSENLANQMDAIVDAGQQQGWTKQQYRQALDAMVSQERALLRSGTRALNKNARSWAKK